MFIFNKIKLGPFLPRVMLYELILINEIEQRAKIIFWSEELTLFQPYFNVEGRSCAGWDPMLSGADQLHLAASYILYNYVCDEHKS